MYIFYFFVIYVTVSPISNTMLKLHDTRIKLIYLFLFLFTLSIAHPIQIETDVVIDVSFF